MNPRALVVEDDPAIVGILGDILLSLGHDHDAADSMEAARRRMEATEYSYFLIDLEIPVRAGRLARIENGANLIEEIIQTNERLKRRIIAITAHGNDRPHQAVEIMKKGIADYVPKPFPSSGERTLDKAIRRMLADHDAEAHSGGQQRTDDPAGKLVKFVGGEMVFFPERVELCGADICSGRRTSRQRRVLDLLRATATGGSCRGYSCDDLAEPIGIAGKDVPAHIRRLRERISESLRTAACIDCGLDDVILSGGPGFRLSQQVSVQVGVGDNRRIDHGHDLDSRRVDVPNRVPNVPVPHVANVSKDGEQLKRREWILAKMRRGNHVTAKDVETEFGCCRKTALRDLQALYKERIADRHGPPRCRVYHLRGEVGPAPLVMPTTPQP